MLRRDWLKLVGISSFAVNATDIQTDDRIELLVPEAAANGAVVPVSVVSSIPNTLKIVLLVNHHGEGSVAELDTTHALIAPRLSTHLKLVKPATITALVHSDEGWFSRSADVKTLGDSC